MGATAADMEIDDSLLTKPDEELYGVNAVNIIPTTNNQLADIPMPPPVPQPIATKLTSDEEDEPDQSTTSSTDQEDLRNKLSSSRREQDLRSKLSGAIMVQVQITVREKKTPEGNLYPDVPEHEFETIIVSHKNFHNDPNFHTELEQTIRRQVDCSEQHRRMQQDDYLIVTRDCASYKSVDENAKKYKSRYSKLYHVHQHGLDTNKFAPFITDRQAYVFVKVDIYPSITDKAIIAKTAETIKRKEEEKQKKENEKKAEEEEEQQKAIKRICERAKREGQDPVILWPAVITAELQKMKEEKDKEDEECRKELERRVKAARDKQEAENKKNHASWMQHKREKLAAILKQSETTTQQTEQQAQPAKPTTFNQYQTNGRAVKNCINAMKVVASFNHYLTERELAYKLRQLYQEFMHDSAVPEEQVRRRNPSNYEPRYISTPTLKRQRQQDTDRPQHTRPEKRPRRKPQQSSWDSSEPTQTWEEMARRQDEINKATIQAFHNDSDWE